jgi:L-lactate dehydrogenase complex protein LldG
MTSREKILQQVRQHQPPATALLDRTGDWIRYDDPLAKFIELLTAVGGNAIHVANAEAAADELIKLARRVNARQICNLVDGVDLSGLEARAIDVWAVDDPHHLADVDLAILPVHFGVAENGAVWLCEPRLPHRVLPFLTQHLAFFLPSDQIVHNMHEAYERLSFREPGFGVFVSGPSKTADIEQSLVIGAHGARSLTVFLTA